MNVKKLKEMFEIIKKGYDEIHSLHCEVSRKMWNLEETIEEIEKILEKK